MTEPTIFLSFDVEEFDLPLEYGSPISNQHQMNIGFQGLQAITPLLNESFLETTLFTTANFAHHYPNLIKQLSEKHEIASHCFYHSSFENKDLKLSKEKLESITNKKVVGLRMPRLRKVEMSEVKKAGYLYDSSMNPTYLPGRYNNVKVSTTIYTHDGMVRVPTAVTPNFRIPLFWLSFKNLPYTLFKIMALQTLKKYGYLSLYFHPWEFTDISHYICLPSYTRKPCGENLLHKLYQLVNDLKQEARFSSIENYLLKEKLI
ncbi:MAG: DUF3473 domain-containing protein [Chitinophagaceae bacterium]|nr:DUF3473 domain-containing protein [Chitinophagaceae bacterium]